MNQNKSSSPSGAFYPYLTVAVLLAFLVVYWAQLFSTYDTMRNQVRQDTFRLASQTAHALSLQANTLFRKLDYFSMQLSEAWLSEGSPFFDRSVQVAMQTLPEGALTQVAVTDAQGDVVYSRLADGLVSLDQNRPVSIADREHFQVHAGASEPKLFVSLPVLGRISKEWTIQFTRGLWKDGVFDGVLVLAVSAQHLSGALATTFPDIDDVALIARSDGAYLARSRDLDKVLGTWLPAHRPFLIDQQLLSGTYEATAAVDGVQRLYAWWRGEDYPFVLSVGYGTDASLVVTEEAISESIEQNAIGSALLMFAVGVVLWLWVQRSRQTAYFKDIQRRLELALKGGKLAAWDWRIPTDDLHVDRSWAAMFDFESESKVRSVQDWAGKLHPDDRSQVQAVLAECLADSECSFDTEYRVLDQNDTIVWISDRGEVVERDALGNPLRMVGVKQDITQRKVAQQAEQNIREQLSKLVAEIPGAVFQFKRDPKGNFSFPFASPAIKEIYGVSPDQVIISADQVFTVISPLDVLRVKHSIEKSAETLQEWHSEYRVIRPDGEVRWISGHSKPERLKDGSVLWHGYLHDITAERDVAEALKASEAHLRLTLQAVHDGLWSYDHNAQVATWDERIREILGYADEQWKSPCLEDVLSIVHPQDLEGLSRETAELFSRHGHGAIWMDVRMRTADQRWLWVQVRGRVIEWNESGEPTRTVGILTDISERVSQTQLRQALLNRSPAAIVLMSHDRKVIEANDQFKALFIQTGSSLHQVDMCKLHVDHAHFEKMAAVYERLQKSKVVRMDFPLRDINGIVHWFDMHGVLQDPSDETSPVIWTMTDISARHAADQALNIERLRLTALLKRFPGGVLIEDADGKIVFVNDRWCELMRVPINPQSLAGLSHDGLADLIGSDRAQWHRNRVDVGREGFDGVIEVQDDLGRYMETDHLDLVQEGKSLGVVWFFWDITQRKENERQLKSLALTDPLTDMSNRRSFMQSMAGYLQSAAIEDPNQCGVVLMLDIDYFKRVNDTYGHAVGDMVLKQLATTIKGQIREHDLAGRIGGEEFSVVLTETSTSTGEKVAERIRKAVEDSHVSTGEAMIQITISIGLAPINIDNVDELLKRADTALYQAKQAGRNRVCIWQA